MLNIAAIDVGSNAMRMIVGEVDDAWQVKSVENIRLPVRLGQDVFSKGYLEEKTHRQTEEAFVHFKHTADKLWHSPFARGSNERGQRGYKQ